MNNVTNFLLDAKVHDTVLITMVITSFLAALPRPVEHPISTLGILYKFFYDWLVGFWSMKTGQKPPPPPSEMLTATSTSTQIKSTSISASPTLPEEIPAKT